jgi:hypothetical protein
LNPAGKAFENIDFQSPVAAEVHCMYTENRDVRRRSGLGLESKLFIEQSNRIEGRARAVRIGERRVELAPKVSLS